MKLSNIQLDFVIDNSPKDLNVNVEEIIEKIISSDPDLAGVVDGKLVIIDKNLEEAINTRMNTIAPSELAEILTSKDVEQEDEKTD